MYKTGFFNAELAIRLCNIVHNRYKNVPIDIGIGIELAKEVSIFQLEETGKSAAEGGRKLRKAWQEFLKLKEIDDMSYQKADIDDLKEGLKDQCENPDIYNIYKERFFESLSSVFSDKKLSEEEKEIIWRNHLDIQEREWKNRMIA